MVLIHLTKPEARLCMYVFDGEAGDLARAESEEKRRGEWLNVHPLSLPESNPILRSAFGMSKGSRSNVSPSLPNRHLATSTRLSPF